jgi:hypothetical protein
MVRLVQMAPQVRQEQRVHQEVPVQLDQQDRQVVQVQLERREQLE